MKDLAKSEQGQSGSVNFLEKITSSGAGTERIPLSKGSFIIGRSEELAQYVEKEAGVSRAHVELMILEDACRIKDLGSRNGTKLNGELLAPYKDYPLEPGDSFTIAEVTFRYSRENQSPKGRSEP
ncbi:FHA domain-containing protein [Paenibacillus sp. YSY-4.3]